MIDLFGVSRERGVEEAGQPSSVLESADRVQPSLSFPDLEARLRRYNSDLDPVSDTFKAACVLLAGSVFGHNIDVLARRTGYPRALVARIARRLIDNGVWSGGRTLVDWSADDEASGTFWNDVAVAEGKMCRRSGAAGSTEWAPAGFWNKNFHFVDPAADERVSTHYLDPDSPAPAVVSALRPDDAATTAIPEALPQPRLAAPPALDAGPARIPDPVQQIGRVLPGEIATVIVGPAAATASPLDPPALRPGRSTVPALGELFGDVVWIG